MKKQFFLGLKLFVIFLLSGLCAYAQNSKEYVSNTFRISAKKQVIAIYPNSNNKKRLIDIEENITESKVKNNNGIAFLISVSDYQNPSIPKMKFAKKDASLMKEYLIKRLGYDPKNIYPKSFEEIPTAGYLKTFLKDYLKRILRPDGKSELFIYYVGHGAPSLNNGNSAYLVPYDANPNYLTDINAYAINEFFADINVLNAAKKTIVIDACFSGQSGDGTSLIANASPLTIKPKVDIFSDEKSAIFMSSRGDQVSNWYPEMQHGLFTYFFLKGLKGIADLNTDGKITLQEMETYLNDPNEGIPYISNKDFQRPQEAQIIGNKQAIMVVN